MNDFINYTDIGVCNEIIKTKQFVLSQNIAVHSRNLYSLPLSLAGDKNVIGQENRATLKLTGALCLSASNRP